jgi:predicted transcriptional regulator
VNKLSIIIPKGKRTKRPVERLIALGEKCARSVNYLVVEAILQYLEREEGD